MEESTKFIFVGDKGWILKFSKKSKENNRSKTQKWTQHTLFELVKVLPYIELKVPDRRRKANE